mgnify:CR=1 FL=1|jgi:hypothetical protein
MNQELEDLLKELREHRADMVAKNYPYQRISDIITRWEMREFVPAAVAPSRKLDFLEEAEKEKQELKDSYEESVRQANERKDFHPKAIDGYGE